MNPPNPQSFCFYLCKSMKRIFEALWAAWAMLVFVVSLLVVTPLYYLILIPGGREAEARAHTLSRIWAYYLLFVFGIRLKVTGRTKLHPDTSYVFVSNHLSMLDIPICAIATGHFFKFLAKDDLLKIPLLGYIIKRLYITVSRKSNRDKVKSLIKMKDALQQGTSVWIFPEGTRNRGTNPLNEFQDGAFQVAATSGKPLGVLTIVGSRDTLPTGESFRLSPGKVRVFWDVLPVSKDAVWLKERTKEIMMERLS